MPHFESFPRVLLKGVVAVEQVCVKCGKSNPPEEKICFSCGELLPAGQKAISTHALEDDPARKPELRWGTAFFGHDMMLRIHVRCTNEIVEVVFKDECVLGRESDGATPDVDLNGSQGAELGVSRRHAKLTRQHETVMVQDLGSLNGTFLNGQKLLPYQPRVLRNGDELSLGHLAMRIVYLRTPKPDPIPKDKDKEKDKPLLSD
jgi:hypothetical protein